jgi:hypothetical protein
MGCSCRTFREELLARAYVAEVGLSHSPSVRVPDTPPVAPSPNTPGRGSRVGDCLIWALSVLDAGNCNFANCWIRARLWRARVGLPPISPSGTTATPSFLIKVPPCHDTPLGTSARRHED